MLSRKTWITFVLLQLIGLLCFLVGPHVLWGGAEMVFAGLILLLPGSVAAVAITEKLLWRSMGLNPAGLTIAEVILELLINLIIWFAVAQLIRLMRRRRAPEPPASVSPHPSRP
jgi:hypothetical protein